MTSKQSTECYVYITLPGETESVTAGRFELSKDRRGNALGRFVYGKSYLARANVVAIDPIELKLSGATLGPATGAVALSKSMQECLSSANSTICSTRRMTAREHLDLDLAKNPPL